MLQSYTARHTRFHAGYMGQLSEWRKVVTECDDLDACRAMLRYALQEMISVYPELGLEGPCGPALLGERAGLGPKH